MQARNRVRTNNGFKICIENKMPVNQIVHNKRHGKLDEGDKKSHTKNPIERKALGPKGLNLLLYKSFS